MKILFDQNISFRIIKLLENDFQEAKHVSQLGLSNTKDFEIWAFAKKENYTIVTFDSDFYDLGLLKGFPPKIIWLRMGNLPTKEVAKTMKKSKKSIFDFIYNNDSEQSACLEIDIK